MKDLQIRIISNLAETQQVLLYQEDIELNVKNFLVAAWEHPHIAPLSTFSVNLPMSIGVSAATNVGNGTMRTKQLEADYESAWDIYSNEKGLDIRPSIEGNATDDTIEIHNKCGNTKYAIVTKDSKPLFACPVRPDFKVNFAIHPKLYVALSDMEIHGDFFDAATLSKKPVVIDYEGQEFVTIRLVENVSTGQVAITYDFSKF